MENDCLNNCICREEAAAGGRRATFRKEKENGRFDVPENSLPLRHTRKCGGSFVVPPLSRQKNRKERINPPAAERRSWKGPRPRGLESGRRGRRTSPFASMFRSMGGTAASRSQSLRAIANVLKGSARKKVVSCQADEKTHNGVACTTVNRPASMA